MNKSIWTRRDFVRLGTGAVAMGMASKITLLQPSRLWAANTPTDKIRYGFVGMGVRGCEVLQAALQVPGAECVAISDLYDGRHRAGKEVMRADVFTTREYRQVLDRKDIDAIFVATPDHLHRRIVEEACAAGKDVYCEKPMSHTVEDGLAMVEAARRNKRVVQVGSQRVSSVLYAKAREIYSSGKLGDVYAVEAHWDRNSASGAWVYPIPPDANEKTIYWDGFVQDAPKRAFDPVRFFRWRCYKDYGEGLAGDLFVHMVSAIQFITDTNTPPLTAQSIGGLFRFKDGREFPDLIQTLYEYPKFHAFLRCNLNNDAGEFIAFYGTKGTLILSGPTITFKPQDTRPQPESYSIYGWPNDLRTEYLAEWNAEHPPVAPLAASTETETEVFKAPPRYNDTVDHVAQFFNSIRTRKPPVENEDFGNSASIACHMANDSYFNRTAAVWDSQAKKIKG